MGKHEIDDEVLTKREITQVSQFLAGVFTFYVNKEFALRFDEETAYHFFKEHLEVGYGNY